MHRADVWNMAALAGRRLAGLSLSLSFSFSHGSACVRRFVPGPPACSATAAPRPGHRKQRRQKTINRSSNFAAVKQSAPEKLTKEHDTV